MELFIHPAVNNHEETGAWRIIATHMKGLGMRITEDLYECVG